jgi:hypothetical protein
MRIAPKYRIASWSAGLLTILLLPGSLWGEQTLASDDDGSVTAIATDCNAAAPVNQTGFVPNWKQLLSLIADGENGNDPRQRFFVSYEQMLFGTSPAPAHGALAPNSGHAAQQALSAASMPVSGGNDTKSSFSATAWESLGLSAIGSLIPNLGTGSRLEFGRMETDNTGWSVSILDLNNTGATAQSPDGHRAAR